MGTHRIRIILIYLFGAFAVAAFLGNAGPFLKYKSLERDGLQTTGVVVRPDCDNHNTFRYRFNALGKDYEASGTAGVSTNCRTLLAGDRVDVRYLPRDPDVNMSGDPRAALSNEVASIGLAAVLMPAFVIFVVSLRLRNRKSRAQSASRHDSQGRRGVTNVPENNP
jgi:hypothetical protein